MKIYKELIKKPVFSLDDVKLLCNITGTAKNHIVKLVKDGYTYKCVVTKNISNLYFPTMNRGVRISNIERTIVDSLKDMNEIAVMKTTISFLFKTWGEIPPTFIIETLLNCPMS